jgi:hypothetical protein
LLGPFGDLRLLKQVILTIDGDRYFLESIACSEFDSVSDKISQLDLGDPDIVATYQILNLRLMGRFEGE